MPRRLALPLMAVSAQKSTQIKVGKGNQRKDIERNDAMEKTILNHSFWASWGFWDRFQPVASRRRLVTLSSRLAWHPIPVEMVCLLPQEGWNRSIDQQKSFSKSFGEQTPLIQTKTLAPSPIFQHLLFRSKLSTYLQLVWQDLFRKNFALLNKAVLQGAVRSIGHGTMVLTKNNNHKNYFDKNN